MEQEEKTLILDRPSAGHGKVKTARAVRKSAPALAAIDGQESDGSRIKSLSMTIRLLTEMAHGGRPVGVTELARRVGESKARIHRHLQTLRDAGLLAQSHADERYRLGWVLFELGQAAAAQFDIAEIATAAMRQLRDSTHLTVILGQRDGDEVMICQTIESERMIAVTARKGLRLPARYSAMGRVMLAFATPHDQQRIWRLPAPRDQQSRRHTLEQMREKLARIRERRFEISEGESASGISGIAAPILDKNSNLIAMVGVVGTKSQVGDGSKRKLIDLVLGCAATIAAVLMSGYDRKAPRPHRRALKI